MTPTLTPSEALLDLRRVAVAIGAPQLPRRTTKDEARWAQQILDAAQVLAAAHASAESENESLRAELGRVRATLSDIHRVVQRDVHDEDAESIERMCAAWLHDSDCAQHNEPAYPNGPCDCALAPPPQESK